MVSTAIGLYIVDPFVRYFPSMVVRIAGALSQQWADEIFKNAAQPESTEGLLLVLVALGFAIAGMWFGPFLDQSDHPAKVRQRRFFRGVIVGGCAVMMVLLAVIGSIRDTSSSIERCFRYRLAVLSPHLSDLESKELSASWTLMLSRADYDAIRGRLKQYAEKYNVVPVIKSLETTQQQGQRRCI